MFFSLLGPLLVLMLNMVMNGENQQIVTVGMVAHIVTQEQSNNFILR